MRHTRRDPKWWNIGVPLLLLGGLGVLEHQAPLSPGSHQVAEIAIVLLTYGTVVCWLRCNRGALVHQEYEREQRRERAAQARRPGPEPSLHGVDPGTTPGAPGSTWNTLWRDREDDNVRSPLRPALPLDEP